MTIVALSYGYLRESASGELYVLLLLATMGAAVLAASDHFASFFLGLEILDVSRIRRHSFGFCDPLRPPSSHWAASPLPPVPAGDRLLVR
jgi:hypothetical protein